MAADCWSGCGIWLWWWQRWLVGMRARTGGTAARRATQFRYEIVHRMTYMSLSFFIYFYVVGGLLEWRWHLAMVAAEVACWHASA